MKMKWLLVLLLPISLISSTLLVAAKGPKTAAPPTTYLVLIVLDGARPDYLTVPNIPHVRALMQSGMQYTNAFAGILESETPSAHVAIGTGSEPRNDGVLAFWWGTSENIQINLFDPTKIRAGEMEKVIKNSGATTIAGLVHRTNMNAKVVALSGNKYYAADAIGGPNADTIMYFERTAAGGLVPTYIPAHPPAAGVLTSPGLTTKTTKLPLGTIDRLAMNLAVDTFNRTRQQVTLINLPEFDWPLGHVYGGNRDPKDETTLMQAFDRDLGMLEDGYRKAGVLDRTVFVVMSDHGMSPLWHTVSKTDLTNAIAKAGGQLVSQTYTTGAYFWLKNDAVLGKAATNIVNMHNPYIQSVYARTRTAHGYTYVRVSSGKLLRATGTEAANQYLLNSFNGSSAPDIVVAFTEGAGCEPGGQASWKADHGGTSWQAQHIPLIISGPGVRHGVSSYPARLIDVAPTVLQLMGVPVIGMHGIPLADAMTTQSAQRLQAQQAEAKILLPIATALQKESQLELSAKL
jgi:predicted AlkP superfamily pyrophosphatase or phosphodiesterase